MSASGPAPTGGAEPGRSASGTGDFSVLLPVYAADRVDQFEASFESVTAAQTLAPAQVVLVRDGPVGEALGLTLARLARRRDVDLVASPRNRGLAAALNAGLAACRHDVVARQDADDLSRPERFALTVPLVADGAADLVGAALREFRDKPGDLGRRERVYPTQADGIVRAARLVNPVAHPTVVYRRAAVLAQGGYRPFHHLEDYDLWVRLLRAGARVLNLPDVLVDYRVSPAAYRRRGGWATLRAEWALQREFRRSGFTGPLAHARNLVLRGGFEIAPIKLRRWALGRLTRP
ncbi:MAG: glycosyltransferase [Bifidobacteriaceae bacterium]|nr:glycosyltransferase [Bifidobacteriaceae bacterium]